jgi:hypothetical protein
MAMKPEVCYSRALLKVTFRLLFHSISWLT